MFVLKRALLPDRGLAVPDSSTLALNLSFVLHERSDSAVVRSAVRSCQSHARAIRGLGVTASEPVSSDGFEISDNVTWLSLRIGLPHLLARALDAGTDRVHYVDADGDNCRPRRFFGASAMILEPDIPECTVGVAALVLRPDRRTTHLAISGTHDWPAERDEVFKSLERLVQMHAGQWMPSRPLWTAPAESLLPEEVY